MPGLYSITTRITGETIDATKYNADHQNHVDNNVPTSIDDYSSNATQMQTVTDPGESGTESLATSLAGELERLRFIIKEMKGTAQWYISATTRNMMMTAANQATDTVLWTATGTTIWEFRGIVPDGWTGGDMTFKLIRRAGASGGTSKMTWTFVRIRDAAAPSSPGSAAIDFTPGDTNSHVTNLTITGSTFQAGDTIIVTVTRNGDDAGDTHASTVNMDAGWLQFTGTASR